MLHIEKLKKYSVILASQSPRRKEILSRIPGFTFTQVTSPFDEDTIDKNSFPSVVKYVTTSAALKAKALLDTLDATDSEPLIVAADTVVVQDGEILEKPKSPEENLTFMQKLNGTAHSV